MPNAAPTKPRAGLGPDAVYWKNEAQRIIKERDEIKRSLAAQDGAANYWRGEARKSVGQLAAVREAINEVRSESHRYRVDALGFSEQVDTLRHRLDTLKLSLWELWSGLEDENPAKQQLWSVWAAL